MEGFWERFGVAFAGVRDFVCNPEVWKSLAIIVVYCVVEFIIGGIFYMMWTRIHEIRRKLWQNILLHIAWGALMAIWIVTTGAVTYGLTGDASTSVGVSFVVLVLYWLYYVCIKPGRWW